MARKPKATRRERRDRELAARKAERRVRTDRHAVEVVVLATAFVVSGSAGLMHEVVWTRLLGHVFGVSSLAVSTVLAAYMGGLALGSWGSGRWLTGERRRTYAWLEIGIGIAALLVPFALAAVEPLYGAIWRRFHLSFLSFSALRFLVAGSVLLVPTVLMGATLPVLAGYLAEREGRKLAPVWLYTLNLAGAGLGVALGGFVLMPALGVWGTIVSAALLNAAVGVVVLTLPASAADGAPEPAASAAPVPALLLTVAALSGAVALGTQVAWTRVLLLVVGSTTYAFSAVLLVYLAALGAGSAWAALRSRRGVVTGELAVMHWLAALATVGAVWSVDRVPGLYLSLYGVWAPQALNGIVARAMTTAAALCAVPVVCAGTILPLVLDAVAPAGGHATGPVVGRVYAINTLGAIVGAVVGGFVLIPLVGTEGTLLLAAALTASMGAALALRAAARRRLLLFGGPVLAIVVLGIVFRPAWDHARLHAGVFEPARHGDRLSHVLDAAPVTIFQREGRTASVMVVEAYGIRGLSIDARPNASDAFQDMATQTLVAQIPLLLAPRVDDVFVVGWGSGVTVGAALQSDARHVTAVELEPAVVEASRLFKHINHDPASDPRLELYEDDARHILLADDRTYDVIINEPSHPWVAGVANMFTQDFHRLAATRLRPDGVFAQWVQSYEISLDIYRSLLATMQSVFPETLVFLSPATGDTILVGSRVPLRIDLARLDARWNVAAARAELARIGLTRPEHLLATFALDPEGVRGLTSGVRLNTDDNMNVELNGSRGLLVASAEVSIELERRTVPVERVLTDPNVLLGDRSRLEGFVDGLKKLNRPLRHYQRLVAGPPA